MNSGPASNKGGSDEKLGELGGNSREIAVTTLTPSTSPRQVEDDGGLSENFGDKMSALIIDRD